jgi:hypothetical protein
MPTPNPPDTLIPVLLCASLPETLKFYRALGFEVVREQTKPYVWGEVRRGAVEIHFTKDRKLEPGKAFSLCLVMVAEVEELHRTFVEGLKREYGRLPLAGLPRITRLRKGGTRVKVWDPAGNALLFISRNEPAANYDEDPSLYEARSALANALETAAWLRDLKGHDDAAAAKVLDVALAKNEPAPNIDLARALAARAELAVALGDLERSHLLRAELQQVPLTDEEREQYREELEAADELERLLR